MVLKYSKALARRETLRCEQLKKNEKKTCTHPRLRGVRWSQGVKSGLGAFPSMWPSGRVPRACPGVNEPDG